MNIKQAEIVTGISKRNIRFYEKEGLVCPRRNEGNDYREYSEEDIKRLKMIRMLRMVNMPLEQIKDVISGKLELDAAAEKQKGILYEQAKELEIAICFCEELEKCAKERKLDVDEMLMRMDQPENQKALFVQWMEDYKRIAGAEHKKKFVFYPDIAVTNPTEFTLALCEYAEKQKINLIITKEGMYPEFTIDGIEYKAERYYRTVHRVPVIAIRCSMVHPEEIEPDMPKNRKRILKALHYSWVLVLFIIICLPSLPHGSWGDLLKTWQGWVVLLATLVLAGAAIYRFYIFYYNERG